MKSLVVGYGSIGQRHARLLGELACDVAVVSRRSVDFDRVFGALGPALASWQPEYVVLAGRTNEHFDDLAALIDAGFGGRVLIEKPLFDKYREPPPHAFSRVAVAYNLRFHPLLLRLRDFLASQARIVAAQIYVGQYLPQWRPTTDYRQSYSASRVQGGGVLRDLSHELDYALWLLGPWQRLAALGGHFSPLEIDSDDVYSLLYATPRCPAVSLHLNYLDRTVRREILIHTDSHSVRVDLVKGIFEVDGQGESIVLERDHTYLSEHRAMLSENPEALCTLAEGMETLAMIDAAERSAHQQTWISR